MIDDYSALEGLFVKEFAGPYGAGLEPFLMAFGDEAAVARAEAELQGAHPHLSVYRPGDYPPEWRFDHPTRGPDLFILADPDWLISRSDANFSSPYLSSLRGQHGYDNRAEPMGATFIGAGPVFPQGTRPDAFENVNVYGIIACALDLEPAETDGDPAEVARITGGHCPAEE
jgi:alkaline phosphatase D